MRLALILCFCASALQAAPERSIRPVERAEPTLTLAAFRPVARPDVALEDPASLRPLVRPRALEQKAMARRAERARGAVCGDPDLQGDVVGAVPGRIRGCGLSEAVKLREVMGIKLSQQAVIDCGTAKALKTWVKRSAKPALSNIGGGLERLRVAAHYACRTRNNQPGARISEHGKGRAIDISGFYLKDGSLITVQDGWGSKRAGKALRKMHKGACGPFGTVLGPNSDRFHRDHFHFDTARYRSGPYCR